MDSTIKKNLHYSTAEGSLTSVSESITNTYVTPYALSMGAKDSDIGMLGVLQNLASTVAQIPGASFTEYVSRKKIWVFSTLASKLLWIPVILLPLLSTGNIIALIILLALISFFSSLRAPAWTSLMGDIVPGDERGHYFGKRNMIAGFAGLIATLIVGLFIAGVGFSVILGVSIIAGMVSIIFFIKIEEPSLKKVFHYKHEFKMDLKNFRNSVKVHKNFVIFTLFLSMMSFAVNIAAPFFAVYQLRYLGIGNFWFGIVAAFGALITLILQPYWGRLNDKFGERSIMVITGILVCFVPFFYLFVKTIPEILIVEAFSSFAWAGFNLVTFNYLLSATPPEKRPSFVANHTIIRGIAAVGGTLLGVYLALTITPGTFILFFAGIQFVFFVSFFFRISSVLLLLKIKKSEIDHREAVPIRYVFWHSVAVQPMVGLAHKISYTFHYPYDIREIKDKTHRQIERLYFKYKIRKK